MSVQPDDAQAFVGTWRRFGAYGPAYEVIAVGGPTENGRDRKVKIRLAETGEIVDYPLDQLLEDEILVDRQH
jgi:hypothetical protein